MKFIDLFAGVGGFHLALSQLGLECVFASEKQPHLIDLYERNWGMRPNADIRAIDVKDIPVHDVLCAGFPCQPFSIAGKQEGFKDADRGTLFYEIIRILAHHNPTYFILENVVGLTTIDNGRTFKNILSMLKSLDYHVDYCILSPHQLGFNQSRSRVFIVGSKHPLNFTPPSPRKTTTLAIDLLDKNHTNDTLGLSVNYRKGLQAWRKFFSLLPPEIKVVPNVLSFGDYCNTDENLCFSDNLIKKTFMQCFDDFIELPLSYHNLQFGIMILKYGFDNVVIMLRISGFKVSSLKYISTIVTKPTNVPYFPALNRMATPLELLRFQGLEDLSIDGLSRTQKISAVGNAVHAGVVKMVASALIFPPLDSEKATQLELFRM